MRSHANLVCIPSLGFAARYSLNDATRGRVGTQLRQPSAHRLSRYPRKESNSERRCTFRKLRRLEISSNRERANAELARDGSFGDAVAVRLSYRLKQCSPLVMRMVFLIVLVEIAGCFQCDFVGCWRRFSR